MISIIFSVLIVIGIVFFLLKGAIGNYHLGKKISYVLGALAAAYVISLILQVLWLFDIYAYRSNDLLTLTCMVIIAQTISFYFFVTLFKKNNLTSITLALYLVGLGLILLSPLNFVLFAPIASFFFMLLIFLNLLDRQQVILRKISYSVMAYSGIAVILFFLIAMGFDWVLTYITVINFIFLLIAYYMSNFFHDYSERVSTHTKDKHVIIMFLKYFIFIIAFTNIVLISTLGLHELSHITVARYYGCDARAIFFEKGIYPYSEINCTNVSGNNLIALAGPILPLVFALLLFFVDNSIIRATSLLVAGFNLIAGYKDFKEIQTADSIILAFTMFGVLLLLLGLVYLAKFIFYHQNRNQSHDWSV